MKKTLLTAAILITLTITNCASNKTDSEENIQEENISQYIPASHEDLQTVDFKEVWGYVVAGAESAWKPNMPVTDIAYFGMEVNYLGNLTAIPRRAAIPASFKGKVHLVVVCNSYSLSHFVLKPGSSERKNLITQLIAATSPFDGLNIDMESVPGTETETFASFLVELREGLPGKMLTICVPARNRKIQNDAYDYDRITPLVDRVFVMAYDEHWSGSRPGSVASIGWCRGVAEYSLRAVGREKLIMGLPFYGRAWGNYSPSRALTYGGIAEVISVNNVDNITYENGIPTFTYDKTVSIKVYYEDNYSLVTRMSMYKSMGVNSIGFWRLGQEIPSIWQYLKITSNIQPAAAAAPPSPANQPAVQTAAPSPSISASIPAPAPSRPVSYTVLRGDSLWGIARYFGVSIQALADANGMKVNDVLYAGRVLRIP